MNIPAKTFLTFIALFFSSFNGHLANANEIPEVKIISHGIYAHSPDNGKTWINPVSDLKIKGNSASPVHIKSTRDIPAQFPLFFGFEYQINELKEKTTTITTEVTHPAIKQSDDKIANSYQAVNKFLILDGKITAINGYLLEDKSEITPGKWTFKIKHKDKVIITQSFNVISQ